MRERAESESTHGGRWKNQIAGNNGIVERRGKASRGPSMFPCKYEMNGSKRGRRNGEGEGGGGGGGGGVCFKGWPLRWLALAFNRRRLLNPLNRFHRFHRFHQLSDVYCSDVSSQNKESRSNINELNLIIIARRNQKSGCNRVVDRNDQPGANYR